MKGTLVLATLICFATMAATSAAAPVGEGSIGVGAKGAPLSPADAVKPVTRAQLRRMSTAERIRYNGGLLFSAPTGKVIRVVNAQKLVPASTLDPMIDGFKVAMGLTLFPMEVEEKGLFPVVKRGFAVEKTGAVLALIDDPDAPRILCAPEESWAAVNVRALSVDSPQPDVLKKRVIKEAWRSLSIALGASDTMYRPCLLSPTHSLADLDANVSLVVSPEPFSKMMDNAEALGIRRVRHTTYRKACYEGWAPPPTNDVQRAIWEKIKADKERGPTNPITIPPPNAKK